MAVFTFGKELVSSFEYIENIDEVRNHIVIEGEEYSIYDELYRILDGTEIMYTLDDVPDGAAYVRMPLTSVTAGQIIVAGCAAAVTDRMFTAPAAKSNIEAWMKAGDTTFIDGGFIYTSSVVVAGLNAAVTNRMFGTSTIKTNIEAWRHASDATLIDGGDIYANSIVAASVAAKTLTLGEVSDTAFTEIGHSNLIRNSVFNYDGQTMNYLVSSVEPAFWDVSKSAGTFGYCQAYAVGETYNKKPWDYLYYVAQTAIENDATDYVRLVGEEYITVDRTEPYTLSLWIRRHGTVLRWYLGLFFYDSDKVACAPTAYGTPSSMSAITTTTNTWTRYSGTFGPNSDDYDVAFPADCKYVRIRFIPMYMYGSGSSIGSMSTGLQLEPGDKLTNWKPWNPDFNETVLDLWQGEEDTQIFRMRSKSVGHDITQGGGLGYDWGTHTDCFYYMRKRDESLGGVFIASFTESTEPISYQLYAIYGDANNAKDGNATGPINFAGLRGDAANHTYRACEANDNIFVIKTKPEGGAYKAIHIFDEDGDHLYDGTSGAFQDEDDVAMLKDVEDILSDKIDKHAMKEKHVSKIHKVVHVNEVDEEEIDGNKTKKTGKKRLDRFVSTKKLNMLLMGSIRQLNEKIESLEARIN